MKRLIRWMDDHLFPAGLFAVILAIFIATQGVTAAQQWHLEWRRRHPSGSMRQIVIVSSAYREPNEDFFPAHSQYAPDLTPSPNTGVQP